MTAHGYHDSLWGLAFRPAQHLAGFAVRLASHGAGIDDIHIGNFIKANLFEAGIGETAGYGVGFIVVCLAPEGVECCFQVKSAPDLKFGFDRLTLLLQNKVMKVFTVNLKSITEVKEFVRIVNDYAFNVDLISGRYIVDAKSIMGIFSLDLSRPIALEIHSDSADDLIQRLEPFIIQSSVG